MKVAILFGGDSREREIAFAGGRTVYDNLDKSIFTAVPIFVDSLKQCILLDWKYIYKGTIRDFYPPAEFAENSDYNFQIYIDSLQNLPKEKLEEIANSVGKRIEWHELGQYVDFAFLALHGRFGEDGQVQGLLSTYNIPYSGSGILASAIGINKSFQKEWARDTGFGTPSFSILKKADWHKESASKLLAQTLAELGSHFVIRPANQGSSIGISILENPDEAAFVKAINKGFFKEEIFAADWKTLADSEKNNFIRNLADIREGIGLPLLLEGEMLYHPVVLLQKINAHFAQSSETLNLEAVDSEQELILESFIDGREFSCIVIEDLEGKALALPPTEIIKGKELFDYRSKYLAGLSRKQTPIDLPDAQINEIRQKCVELYKALHFDVYARIDGFIKADGTIFLNDPNTTSGMLPSSFFFHQAAEIGLNPSQFLSYLIWASMKARIQKSGMINSHWNALFEKLNANLLAASKSEQPRKKIGVILGGFSTERHISIESGRNVFEKLASSSLYEPVPIFLTGSESKHELYQIPIHILLKDNADDIKDKIISYSKHSVIEEIKQECIGITNLFTRNTPVYEPIKLSYADLKEQLDAVFIALHGRPGEDGAVQQHLDALQIPYNGSGVESSQTTINKFKTLRILKAHGFEVADQILLSKTEYQATDFDISQIIKQLELPLIAKPVDDGCSSAVKKINTKEELEAYLQLIFRSDAGEFDKSAVAVLKLRDKEEFPVKDQVLLETFTSAGDAKHFMEITGGMLSHIDEKGNRTMEVFEPSEALAGGEILSLEEKFLAGEGQNITPARFGNSKAEYDIIAKQVKESLGKAAEILNVEGYCRIDAFVRIYENLKAETIIIEVNSLPGMTPATCIFHQAAINGYKPFEFIDTILDYGFKRQTIEAH